MVLLPLCGKAVGLCGRRRWWSAPRCHRCSLQLLVTVLSHYFSGPGGSAYQQMSFSLVAHLWGTPSRPTSTAHRPLCVLISCANSKPLKLPLRCIIGSPDMSITFLFWPKKYTHMHLWLEQIALFYIVFALTILKTKEIISWALCYTSTCCLARSVCAGPKLLIKKWEIKATARQEELHNLLCHHAGTRCVQWCCREVTMPPLCPPPLCAQK